MTNPTCQNPEPVTYQLPGTPLVPAYGRKVPGVVARCNESYFPDDPFFGFGVEAVTPCLSEAS